MNKIFVEQQGLLNPNMSDRAETKVFIYEIKDCEKAVIKYKELKEIDKIGYSVTIIEFRNIYIK